MPQRYYVRNSSYFDSHPYNKQKIAAAVKKGGGTRVNQSNAYGWSNQPKVVTFAATPSKMDSIQQAVKRAIGTDVIIDEKDW